MSSDFGTLPGPWIAFHDFEDGSEPLIQFTTDREQHAYDCRDATDNNISCVYIPISVLKVTPALFATCKEVADWNDKYPSHRIFSDKEIVRIADEMDSINQRILAAFVKAEGK